MTAAPAPQERRRIFAGCCEHSDLWHDGHGCVSCDCKDRRMAAVPTVSELLSLLADLVRDNDLTCEPHPENKRCVCSTARAARVIAGEHQW